MSDNYQLYYHNDLQQAAFKVLNTVASYYKECCIHPEFNEFNCDVYVLLDQLYSNIIAIDWDNTFTAHPDFYHHLIDHYLTIGFQPIICTLRDDHEEDIEDIHNVIQHHSIPIFPTSGQLKQPYMQKRGIAVNLWIDDFFPCIANCDSDLIINNGIQF